VNLDLAAQPTLLRPVNRPSPDPGKAFELVGVAGFEPAASSSRTPQTFQI